MTDSTTKPRQIIAYYRVSTKKQGRSGLGLEAQIKAVQDYAASVGAVIIAEFQEVESGKRHHNRPELLKALALCRQKKALLVIACLDRLARNVAFTANLMESRVKFVCCDMPEASDLTIHIMAAIAQDERRRISGRTKNALAAAKARGQILGNPNPPSQEGNQAWSGQAAQFRETVYPYARQLRDRGLTLRQIAQELNERNIKTCNNRVWYGQTVNRLLKTTAKEAA